MAGLTVSDIFTRVKDLFGDQNGTQITEAMVIRWINDAQREAAMQHDNMLPAESFVDVVQGTAEYALPSGLIALRHVQYKVDSSYYRLQYMTTQQMAEYIDNYYDGSEYGEGVPTVWTREKEGYIRIFPNPNLSTTSGIRFLYSRYPTSVTTSASDIDLPEYYDSYVEHFCMMKAYELDENWEAADRKAQIIQNTLDFNNNRESYFGKGTYPTITTQWEDNL